MSKTLQKSIVTATFLVLFLATPASSLSAQKIRIDRDSLSSFSRTYPAAFPSRSLSARTRAGPISTWTAATAVSATWNTPTQKMAGWRCSTAIWPNRAAS